MNSLPFRFCYGLRQSGLLSFNRYLLVREQSDLLRCPSCFRFPWSETHWWKMATRAQACVPCVRKGRGRKFGRAPRASCAPEIPFPLPFEHLQRKLRASLDWVRDRRGALSSCFSWLWGSRAYPPTIFVGKHETARGLLLLEGLYFEGISFFWVS